MARATGSCSALCATANAAAWRSRSGAARSAAVPDPAADAGFHPNPGRVTAVARTTNGSDSRDVSLTIPARPDYLVLARLALSAVCRLTPLSPDEVADLKLAITEAANDYVDESRALDDESRLSFSFKLGDNRLTMDLDGPAGSVAESELE